MNIAWFGVCGPRSSFRSNDVTWCIPGDNCAVACNFCTILHIKLRVNKLVVTRCHKWQTPQRTTENVRAKQRVSGQGVRRRGSERPQRMSFGILAFNLAAIGSKVGKTDSGTGINFSLFGWNYKSISSVYVTDASPLARTSRSARSMATELENWSRVSDFETAPMLEIGIQHKQPWKRTWVRRDICAHVKNGHPWELISGFYQ